MQNNSNERYFLLVLLSAVIILALAILYPFLNVIVFSIAFSVVLYPLYSWIKRKIAGGIPWLSSLLTVIIFLVCLCIPLAFIGTIVFNQTEQAYQSIVLNGSANIFIDRIDSSVNGILPTGFTFNAHAKVYQLASLVSGNLASFFTSTLNSVLMFIIMVFSIFYLLKDGLAWKNIIVDHSPISSENVEVILSKLSSGINRIIKGSFFIAIVQGLLTTIGFMIFNIPNPALWGTVAGLASFIPTIGTALVTVPTMIYLYVNNMPGQAIGLLLWSMVLVGTIDNILSPYIVSRDTEVPALFYLFSILGGIALMGVTGILVGPLTLNFLYALIDIYKKEAKV
jgi:predicted PurR-regulated permease PerM